jgi:hypothetical protein
VLLLDIMKETLEDYISKIFVIPKGSYIELNGPTLYGYLSGTKPVVIHTIRNTGNGYIVISEDEDGTRYTVNAETVYLNEFNKVERILYVK